MGPTLLPPPFPAPFRWGALSRPWRPRRQPPEREPIVTYRLRRAILAACLLALLSPTLGTALPWRTSEPPAERVAAVGFLDLLRSALADLFGDAGPGLGPDGSAVQGDNGSGLDPSGG